MSRFFKQAGDSSSDESEDTDEELLVSSGDDEPVQQPAKAPVIGMSKYLWGAKDDDDSSSSSDDSNVDDENSDDEEAKPKPKKAGGKVGWGDGEQSSDEDKVVVKSARDKRLEDIDLCGKAIDNAVKNNDWVAINNEFDKLGRQVERQIQLQEPIPPLFIKHIINLDKTLGAAAQKDKESKKKMNANNARALATMRQKLKKAAKENEADIKAYETNPEDFEAKYASVLVALAPAPIVKPPKPIIDPPGDGDGADDFKTVGKGGKTYNFTAAGLYKTLAGVHESRGRKNTDKLENVRILEKLLEVANTPYSKISVLLALISARFEYNTTLHNFMPTDAWLGARLDLDNLISVLAANPDYIVQEVVTIETDELVERTPETEGGTVLVRGSIISSVERLDDEFTKSLQNVDPHGTEYVDRLKHSMDLYKTICRAQLYFETKNQSEATVRVVMRRVEHIYSKPDAVVQALETAAAASLEGLHLKTSIPTLASCGSTKNLVHTLCVKLYNTDNSFLRTRAILCHIYHHALHNSFHTARDMLFMSHLGDTIQNADIPMQILYNRAVVQLGLCAFRSGLIKEAQATLQDIFTTQRVKELLAQGMHQPKYGSTLTPEQERAERARQLPFHLHINTELLEAAFLVSSMLVEIPLLASIDNEEQKRKAVSKPFRRLLDFADRQVFQGPPETTRDHIMQASKALQEGQWEKAKSLILSIKIWSLMPEEKKIKEMLGLRIQEEGLRTYLFTNSAYYTTLSLSLLAKTFSLPEKSVAAIISRMIWSDELSASLDYMASPDGSTAKFPVVVFHRVELTRMQQLAQTLADKANTMVENNEKTLDQKLGGSGAGGWGENERQSKSGGAEGGETKRGERAGRGSRGRGRGGTGQRGARFAQGLGNRVAGGR
ncbi:Translation initiation factor 3 subunit c [Tulasnella sp. JGI-2019a]|nr:Translation initiation factor 3 subunit c [Tulasnella sp. JGI-2019a]KAG9006947.1 Translation initiation factor 3 subunit c [Tulasnella sp. JGI-2019a]KAG9035171.1 Translation initiation factor 3 subunit c [Tulasnella sp. JGI-2019a]